MGIIIQRTLISALIIYKIPESHVLLKFYLLSFVLNGSMLCFDLSPFRSDLGIVDPSSNMSSPKGPLPGFSTPPPPSPFPDFEVTILFLYKNSFSRGFNVYLCCKNKASWKILTFSNSSFYCSLLIISFGTNNINKTSVLHPLVLEFTIKKEFMMMCNFCKSWSFRLTITSTEVISKGWL